MASTRWHQRAAEGPEAQEQLALFRSHYRLARQLAERRLTLNMTQEDLAQASGVRQSEISRLEHGRGNPTLLTLSRLARSLDLELSLLAVPLADDVQPAKTIDEGLQAEAKPSASGHSSTVCGSPSS
jgi:transcriptional regulator with XRE-family HTH domain